MNVRRPPALPAFLLLLTLLAAALVAGIGVGETYLSPAVVLGVLAAAVGLGGPAGEESARSIVLEIRLPATAGLALVGAALSTTGVLFQGLLRNPLADPYSLGTSGGAAVGAAVGLLTGARVGFLGLGAVPLFAFAGALAAMFLVMQLAAVGGRLPIVTVLLAGFAVSTVLGAVMSLLIQLGDPYHTTAVYQWLSGGVAVTGWEKLRVMAPLLLVGLAACGGLTRSLNSFGLGEEGAARVGIAVERDKRLILVLGSLLTAAAVSLAGLVGFVGLVAPHITRWVVGPDHRRLVPAAALTGAAFLVLCGVLSRVLLPPSGLPVGIVTALVGGPFFLLLLRRSRREYQW